MAFHSRPSAPLRLTLCGLALLAVGVTARAAEEPPHSAELDAMIIRQAKRNGVPEKLVRRIVMRESRYNPRARNHSFWGLMQISYPTARSMGFKGSPQELLNPLVNLTYAVPYLANAFIIAGKREDAAVRLYASGYYATAKNRGLIGMLRTADSAPMAIGTDEPMLASADPQSYGTFGALFSPSQPPQQPQLAEAAYAVPQMAAAADAVPLPQGKDGGDDVELTADKRGVLHPPKKWLRDGGSTTIARGEQSIAQVAAYEQAAGAASDDQSRAKSAHARSRKNTTFAAVDLPPSTAQAYASPGQDPRLAQTDSQAAILQATSGQPPADPAAQPAATPVAAAADTPAESAYAHTARAGRHHDRGTAVADAGADKPKKSRWRHARAKTEDVAVERTDDAQAPQPAPTAQ